MYTTTDPKAAARDYAQGLFDRLWMKGQTLKFWARITGKTRNLLALSDVEHVYDDVPFHILERQSIRLEQIHGTQGRVDRFDSDFLPLARRNKQRWVSIAVAAMDNEITLPPIDVVQVGDIYYVEDGHHRVSVAKGLDKLFIDANVTVWEIDWKSVQSG